MGKGGKDKGKGAKQLRFGVGTYVVCQSGDGWQPGRIVDLWYREEHFPPDFCAPYQVELDNGDLIFVPEDVDQLCKLREWSWWENVFFYSNGEPSPECIKAAAAAPGFDVDAVDYKGTTAFSYAVGLKWSGSAKVLLELGANPNKMDSKRRAPLHRAMWARGGPQQVGAFVKMLLDAKANPNVQDTDPEKDENFNSKSFEERELHRTPLHYCAAGDCLLAAKLLLVAAADPNLIDAQYKTPLHLAIDEESSHAMVTLLLSNKADPDRGNMEIGMTSSYLMIAARNGDAQLAKALIDAKANVDLAGKQGMTPLHMAVRSRKKDVAKLLVEAGCDKSVKALGKTACEIAVTNGQPDLAALLSAEG